MTWIKNTLLLTQWTWNHDDYRRSTPLSTSFSLTKGTISSVRIYFLPTFLVFQPVEISSSFQSNAQAPSFVTTKDTYGPYFVTVSRFYAIDFLFCMIVERCAVLNAFCKFINFQNFQSLKITKRSVKGMPLLDSRTP